VRRFVTVLSTSAAALLLVSAPALAAPGKAAHPAPHAASHAESHGKGHGKPVKRVIELTGVLSDTSTA